MKYLTLLALFLPWTLTAGEPNAPTPEQAYKLVKTANKYSIGGVGVAGTISESEKGFRVILASPDAASQFEKLMSEATPSGQLYALLGLKAKDTSAYQAALKTLESAKTKVTVTAGCEIYETTVAEVAEEIDARKK